MNKEELSKKIHDALMEYSFKIAMESEDGKFSMSDMCEAFHKGTEVILESLNINLD